MISPVQRNLDPCLWTTKRSCVRCERICVGPYPWIWGCRVRGLDRGRIPFSAVWALKKGWRTCWCRDLVKQVIRTAVVRTRGRVLKAVTALDDWRLWSPLYGYVVSVLAQERFRRTPRFGQFTLQNFSRGLVAAAAISVHGLLFSGRVSSTKRLSSRSLHQGSQACFLGLACSSTTTPPLPASIHVVCSLSVINDLFDGCRSFHESRAILDI